MAPLGPPGVAGPAQVLSLKSFYIYNDIILNFTICSLKRVLNCLWLSGTTPFFALVSIIYVTDCSNLRFFNLSFSHNV